MASKKDETVIREPFSQRFASFLNRYKVVLFSVLGILVAVALVLIIVFSVKASNEKKLYRAFAPLSVEYTEVKESEEKDYTALLEKLDSFIPSASGYPLYASLYMRARIYKDTAEYSKAYDDYARLYEKAPRDIYFSDASLFGMAATKDALGEKDEANALYKKVWDDYGRTSAFASRALFELLRYSESIGDESAKIEYRDILQADFAFTDYGRYASEQKRSEEEANSSESSDATLETIDGTVIDAE